MRPPALVALVVVAVVVLTAGTVVAQVTPSQYLQSLAQPNFFADNTLPALSRWGWSLSYNTDVTLADNWGYSLEISGYLTQSVVNDIVNNPTGRNAKIVSLVNTNPDKYKLMVLTDRPLSSPSNMPANLLSQYYCHDANGNYLTDPNGSNAWKAISSEMPDAIYQWDADKMASTLAQLRAIVPINILLNGGEYGLSVCGWSQSYWAKDPTVAAAQAASGLTWVGYSSQRKAHYEQIVTNAALAAVPDSNVYLFYSTGGSPNGFEDSWAYSYAAMKNVSTIANGSLYYGEYNSGWTSGTYRSLYTISLYEVAQQLACGSKLSYNWVCGGWVNNDGNNISDDAHYTGYLKCLYTMGQIGAVAGYFAYPTGGFDANFSPDTPPYWLTQMVDLSRAQAEFSYLEKYIRNGDLLPGTNTYNGLPAYELGSGNYHVLARKLYDANEWLVTAWSGTTDGSVTVSIDGVGTVSLQARAAGSVYLIDFGGPGGTLRQRLMDPNGMDPSATLRMLSVTGGMGVNQNNTTVLAGDSASVGLSVQPGYWISNVLIDGNSFGPIVQCPFNNVQTNHTLSVVAGASLRWTQGGTGAWGTGANWDGGEPSAGIGAAVTNGGTATIDQPGRACWQLAVGIGPGESGKVQMTAGSLAVTAEEYVGASGNGVFDQSGGANTADSVILGYAAGSNGLYKLRGGSLAVNSMTVGKDGNAVFAWTGGTLSAGTVGVGPSGVMDLGGGSRTTGATITVNGGAICNGSLAASLIVGLSGTISASLAGDGSLMKTGLGTLTLTGSNSYSGTTTVDSGMLLAPTPGALPGYNVTGKVTVCNGGTVTVQTGSGRWDAASVGALLGNATFNTGSAVGISVDAGSSFSCGAEIPQNAGLTKMGAGTLVLTNSVAYSGMTTIDQGTLQVGDGTANGTLGSGDVVDNGLLVFNRSDDIYVWNAISGTGGVTQAGTGTMTLGLGTYTGDTRVGSGTLLLYSSIRGSTVDLNAADTGVLQLGSSYPYIGGLEGSRGLTLSSGTTLCVGTNNQNTVYSGVLGGGGTLFKTGTGTLVLSGASTLSGAVQMNQGVLSVPVINDASVAGPLGKGAVSLYGGTLEYTGATASNSRTFYLSNANTIQVDDPAASLTLNGVLSGSSGSLVKAGPGTLALTGSNTFAGTLTVNEGVVSIPTITDANVAGSLGAGNTVVLGSSGKTATLEYTGATASSTRKFTLSDGSTAAVQVDDPAATLTLSGVISGGGSLTKAGTGTLALSGGSTFTGDTRISAGTLTLANSLALRYSTLNWYNSDGGSLSFDGLTAATLGGLRGDRNLTLRNASGAGVTLTIGGNGQSTAFSGILDGNGALTKAGTGTLTLDGNNAFTGKMTIQAGTLVVARVNDASSYGPLGNSASSVTLGSSSTTATLEYTGATASSSKKFSMATNGFGAFQIDSNIATLTLTGAIDGSGGLTKTGMGTLVLAGTNTFSGDTRVVSGTLILTNSLALQSSTLNWNTSDAGSLSLDGLISLTLGELKGDRDLLLQNASGGQVPLTVGGNNQSTAYTGVLDGNGGVTKTGTGTLTLGGANTFKGQLSVQAGGICVPTVNDASVDGPLGNNAYSVILGASTKTGTLEYTGGNASTGRKFTMAQGGTGVFQIDSNVATLTLSGVLDGNGAVTKTGMGMLALAGANTFKGQLSVQAGGICVATVNDANVAGPLGNNAYSVILGSSGMAGTLEYTDGNAASSRKFTIAQGGTGIFQIDSNVATLTVNGVIDGNGAVTKTGMGTLVLAGSNTFTGQLAIQAGVLSVATANDANTTGPLGNSGYSVILGGTGTTGTLEYTGGNAAIGKPFTLAQGGTGVFQIDSNVATLTVSGAIDGNGALTKTGMGTLALSGSNTFSGQLAIKAGVLSVATANDANTVGSLGNSGYSVILGASGTNGTLEYTGTTASSSKKFTMAQGGTGIFQMDNSAATLTLGGVLDGNGALTKTGMGTLALSGSNTFKGQLTVQSGVLSVATVNNASVTGPLGNSAYSVVLGGNGTTGTLEYTGTTASSSKKFTMAVGGGGAFQVDTSGTTLTVSGVIDGSGGLTKTGAGSLTLSGANTFTGDTRVTAGKLTIGASNALAGSTLDLNAADAGTISFGGLTSATIGGLKGSRDLSLQNDSAAAVTATVGGNGQSTTYSGILSGSGKLTKTGTGSLTLSGASTFSGQLTVANGTLSTAVVNNSGVSGPLGTSASAIILGGSGTTGTLEYTDGNATSTRVFLLATSGTGAFQIDDIASTLALTGVISGSGKLTKTGGGTLILGGASTFTGQLTVASGTLSTAVVNNSSASGPLGKSTSAIILGSSGSTGTLEYTDGNATSTRTFSLATSGTGVFQIDNSGATLILSGVFDGNGNLVKTGAGLLTLSGTNTFVGDTRVTAGKLTVGASSALSGSTLDLNVSDAGTVSFDSQTSVVLGGLKGGRNLSLQNDSAAAVALTVGGNGQSTTYAGILSGTGSVIKTGSGTLILGGTNAFSGQLTVANGTLSTAVVNSSGVSGPLGTSASAIILGGSGTTGTLKYTDGNATSTRAFSLATNGTGAFQIDDMASTLALTGVISGDGGLTKTGSGRLTLTTSEAYGGSTTVLDGILDVTGSLVHNGSDYIFVQPDEDFTPMIRRRVGPGASYAGFGSSVAADLHTAADILAGSNSSGTDTIIDMAWRPRESNESFPTQSHPPCPSYSYGLVTDVLNLSGMSNNGVSTQTDPFVLQMSYDPTLLQPDEGMTEAIMAQRGYIYLAWLDPTDRSWKNATYGNYVGAPAFAGLGDWSDYGVSGLADDLGRWGVNPANHTVWAVLDHDSQFAVIPEPATLSLLSLGTLALIRRRRQVFRSQWS